MTMDECGGRDGDLWQWVKMYRKGRRSTTMGEDVAKGAETYDNGFEFGRRY